MMLLGLSGENITRLVAGEPIGFDAAGLGFPGMVVIHYGKTEADIQADIEQHGLAPLLDRRDDGCQCGGRGGRGSGG
jgi:hypothetical protein